MSKASPLGIRLFLEGHEVPVIAAQVSATPNAAALASIQVIPSGMGLHLLPRTLVHLFFLEYLPLLQKGDLKPGEALAEAAARVDRANAGATSLNRIDADDKSYKLMFCGEVIGFNYSKTPTGRQLVLQCMDLSSYWDTCYQWFADYSMGGTALTDKSHMFVGAGEGLFDNVASGTKWVIGNLLNSRPRTPEFQKAKGLLGGLIHLMEAVGGVYREGKGWHGVNDFFTIAELRYNLLGQLGALEADSSSARLYNRKAFSEWLRNGMTSLGNLISFRDVLNHVNRYIFHEVYPNPCPRYLPGSTTVNTINETSTLEDDKVFGVAGIKVMRDTTSSLSVASLKFRAVVEGVESSEPLHVVRLGYFDEGVKALRTSKDYNKVADGWVSRSSADDASYVSSKLAESGSKIDEALKKTSGQTSDLVSRSSDALSLIDEALNTVSSLTDLKHRTRNTTPRRRKVTSTAGDRMFTQLFLPDCFFASPPRCNVIFPDEYFSFNFSRNFLREVTRLSCQGGLGIIGGSKAEAALLGRHYFAPNVRDARGNNLRVTLGYGGRVLMRHETHSGIVPKFTWITQGHRWGVKAAKKVDTAKRGHKVSYVQRLANFQFYLHRWSSRSLTLSCVFRPTLVLGLPALVIDKPLVLSGAVQAAYGEALKSAYIPPQFLGKVVQLSHSINQEGGQTSVTLSHCRLHQGLDDELLGSLYKETFGLEDIEEVDVNYEEMAKDPNYRRGERGGLSKLLRRYKDGMIVEGRPIRSEGIINTVKAGPEVTLRGAQVFNLGLPSRMTEGAKVTIPKTLYVETAKKVSTGAFIRKEGATIEDALRPGWFSEDIWGRENIGTKVYQFLLGCYSITDDVSVSSRELQERFKTLKETGVEVGDLGAAAIVNAENRQAGEDTVKFLEAAGSSLAGVTEGSIEEAVNAIASVYGEIRASKHYNVHEFIRNFTYRPIATMEDVLGSLDLAYGEDGNPASDTMVEGFHSRAYGDYNTEVKEPSKEGYKTKAGKNALFLLFRGKSMKQIGQITMGSMLDRGAPKFSLRPDFDPRGRALTRVKAYAAEMRITRGLIG